MKKILIIVIPVCIIAIVGILIWWYDDTRIIEEPIDLIKNGQKAFSIVDNSETVVLTIYDEEIPRTIFTFYFKDGVVNNTKMEKVYENKRWARGGMTEPDDTFIDRKQNQNVVSGKTNFGIGTSHKDFSENLIDLYSKSMVQIK